MRSVIFRGGIAEEQCKPTTLLSSDLQRLAGLSELPLPLREKPLPPVIGKHKDQARQAGTRDGTGHKQRVIRQNENSARVRFKGRGLGNPHNGFRGDCRRAPLGKHIGERRPINVANSPI
jgi:hypothetical protein